MNIHMPVTVPRRGRGRSKFWTPDKVDELRRLVENGMPVKQIASLVGLTTGGLYARLSALGISTRTARKKSPPTEKRVKGFRNRDSGGTQRRFDHYKVDPADVIPLKPDTHAIANSRSVFHASVKSARQTERLLVSGANNPKIGRVVTKGDWKGMPIYTLTLEERATCPRSCFMWSKCYGNAMHLARRHEHGPDFEYRLELEIKLLGFSNPGGFVVRAHVLGDFYSVEYVALWARLLAKVPELRVYGYTSRDPAHTDPAEAEIGKAIRLLKWINGDRFRIRWSRKTSLPDGATVVDYVPESSRVPEGLVCPAQTEDTACCATCGLCWSTQMRSETIVFIQHGMSRRRDRGEEVLPDTAEAEAEPVDDA